MRNPTPEAIQQEKLLLSKLKDDWERLNRPYVNKELKISLYTRMLEMQANINRMELKLKKSTKGAKVRNTREKVLSE